MVPATGFRPDLGILRELRLGPGPRRRGTAALGPLIDPEFHSCGTVHPTAPGCWPTPSRTSTSSARSPTAGPHLPARHRLRTGPLRRRRPRRGLGSGPRRPARTPRNRRLQPDIIRQGTHHWSADMTDHPEYGLGLQDNTELLHRISARLADRFSGVFAAETVERDASSLTRRWRGPRRSRPSCPPPQSISPTTASMPWPSPRAPSPATSQRCCSSACRTPDAPRWPRHS